MAKNPSNGMSAATKFFLTVIVVLVVVAAGIYLWKDSESRALTRDFEAERSTMVEATREALARQTDEMLRLAAVPLSWSVRSEMIKENFAQIDDYMQRFVKEPHVERVVLINHEGIMQVATDKKLEGRPAGSAFPPAILGVDQATVLDEGAELLVAVPIVSYDARLGTLVLSYSRASIEEKLPRAPAEDE